MNENGLGVPLCWVTGEGTERALGWPEMNKEAAGHQPSHVASTCGPGGLSEQG